MKTVSFKSTQDGQYKAVNVYSKETGELLKSISPKQGQRAKGLETDIKQFSDWFDDKNMYTRIENE